MPVTICGETDTGVEALAAALSRFTAGDPSADATLYRIPPILIRIRVVSVRFRGVSKADRFDLVWKVLAESVPEETLQDVYTLHTVTPEELPTSPASYDFEQSRPEPALAG